MAAISRLWNPAPIVITKGCFILVVQTILMHNDIRTTLQYAMFLKEPNERGMSSCLWCCRSVIALFFAEADVGLSCRGGGAYNFQIAWGLSDHGIAMHLFLLSTNPLAIAKLSCTLRPCIWFTV